MGDPGAFTISGQRCSFFDVFDICSGKTLYAKTEITNAADMKIRGLLDKAESALDEVSCNYVMR
jgi:hypothetical protein